MIRKLIKRLCIVWLGVFVFPAQAQYYNWSAALDSVSQDGFYKLILNPTITDKITTMNYADLRIYDQHKSEVAYLLQEEWNNDKTLFQEYTVLSKENSPERFTKLIIHNPRKNNIDNFSLVVKNNNAYKTAKLSGSDDNQNWYFITDDYQLSLMYDQQGVVNEKRMSFPLSNYEYYKLEVNDSASAPLNILKVGYYTTSVETAKQILLPLPVVHQADSLKTKQTFVEFEFKANFHVHTLHFSINGPKFYKRKAILYTVTRDAKMRVELSEQFRFDLISSGPHTVSIPEVYGKDFLIRIENEDNESLRINSIQAFQTTRYLVSYLERNNHYTLCVGNKKASLPIYDLASFSDSIPSALAEIKPLPFEFIKKQEAKVEVKESWFKSKIWIWSALAIVLGLLGLISYRMIKDMEKKDN
ncbi:MAG: DUF3999 family protein [Cytophagaceae bacterium]|nr:DUF3999 family protein [Cytophagaceae bacterium]